MLISSDLKLKLCVFIYFFVEDPKESRIPVWSIHRFISSLLIAVSYAYKRRRKLIFKHCYETVYSESTKLLRAEFTRIKEMTFR